MGGNNSQRNLVGSNERVTPFVPISGTALRRQTYANSATAPRALLNALARFNQ
jgi:hypothetical protein